MSGKVHTFTYMNKQPLRLDHFLVEMLPERSRSSLQSLIKQGEITVNQKTVDRFNKALAKMRQGRIYAKIMERYQL